jgi:hypothetical protein
MEQIDSDAFVLWRFHFPTGVYNSGFVGRLASSLKNRFGTGVFVTCGQNNQDGGIFDRRGCPWALRDEIIQYIRELCD